MAQRLAGLSSDAARHDAVANLDWHGPVGMANRLAVCVRVHTCVCVAYVCVFGVFVG